MKKQWRIAPLALMVLAVFTLAAQAQRRESQLRTVRGTVMDKEENPVPAGVVYLNNLRARTVKTYIADDKGHYRFSGLDPNADYEIHAEQGDSTSAKRTISSFDSRKDIVIHLKLDREKSEK